MRRRGAGQPQSGLKAAAVVLAAAIVSFQIVRTAAVAKRADRPELASILWSGHPSVLMDQAFLAVASSGASNKPVPQSTRADLRRVATRAPLSPDPYLVEAAIAETAGSGGRAEALLLEARSRDPRSRGTRYLLADRYFRSGRIADGLVEMHVLVGLGNRGGEPFVPALVAYAQTPGAVPQLRAFFAAKPELEASILSTLAIDARNADLVLNLASNTRNPNPDWRATLVAALASAGEYQRAQAAWSRMTRVAPANGLFNPGFAKLPAPPPFNWAFPQSGEGLAEPDGKGGLDVLYYGREKAVLASQLLLLKPGEYRLDAVIEGRAGEDAGLAWRLACAAGGKPFGQVAIRAGAIAGRLLVPEKCEAQRFELVGNPGDVPRTAQVTIRNLRLRAGLGR